MNTTQVNQISQAELISLLEIRSRNGAFAATIETRTTPRMRKTGNPFAGNVVKLARVNVFCNFIYGNAVNRQRVREGSEADFEVKSRTWGERIMGTPFVAHKGKLYVECKVERSLGYTYETLAGEPVEAEALAPFLPERADTGEAQGVERAVILCDYAVSNITAITVDGVRDEVEQAVEAIAA